MLDKTWKIWDWYFNPQQNSDELLPEAEKKKYKNLLYYTLPFEMHFENVDNAVIFKDMASQQDYIKKEIALYVKYEYFNNPISEKIIDQYNNFYFYKWYFYKIDELKLWLVQKSWHNNTFIRANPDHYAQENIPWQKKLVISREAIRKISWYSPRVVPAWSESWTKVYIEWQDVILQDESPIILVDWSRQIWKSLTIAEKAVELSFLPNEDTLVWAFIKKTTDVIRNYMLRHIKKFPEWTFEHFKSEGYILNTKSWTKIYFRTLDNWAENVLWLTLRNIIVDEAQLIDYEVFEDALEPTLATTNGKMILIWTPWRSAKWYYYDLIMEAKRWIEVSWIKIAVKCETNPDLSYYQIDYTQNPLLAPRLKEKIINNLHKASTQRQYCCNWNSWEDQLFQPDLISEYPTLSDDWYFVITFDPARKWTDRSAYCVFYVFNWIAKVIISWFVPKEHKWQWSKQISFYAKWLIKNFGKYKNVVYWVDLRWIWEWFNEAWNNHFKAEQNSKSLIEITYTTWNTETIKWLNWTVSKTKLISNATDHIDEWLVKVLKVSNKDLLEEFQFLYEDEDNKWFVAMKSTYKDDISNAFLTGLYVIKTRWYLKRTSKIEADENFDDWGQDFVPKNKKKKNKTTW